MLWLNDGQPWYLLSGINTRDTKVGQISPLIANNDPFLLGKWLYDDYKADNVCSDHMRASTLSQPIML